MWSGDIVIFPKVPLVNMIKLYSFKTPRVNRTRFFDGLFFFVVML